MHLHFTPTYSSWLNQVETWFGRIEREVIARGVFTSVRDLARKLMRDIRAHSETALLSIGNTPMCVVGVGHANELTATGHEIGCKTRRSSTYAPCQMKSARL